MAISATALTTTAAVQAAVGSVYATARIEQLISAVSAAAERFCGREFAYKALTTSNPEYYHGNGRTHLFLRRYPILTVTRVRINGTAVTDYETTASLLEQGALHRLAGWPMSVGTFGDLTGDPDVSQQGYPVDVVYTAGYILPQYGGGTNVTYNPAAAARDLPYDLEEAIIRGVSEVLARPSSSLTSESTAGGWRRTWGSSSRQGASSGSESILTPEVQSLLMPFKSRWFA